MIVRRRGQHLVGPDKPLNIPFNGLSVVLDAGTDEMLADPVTRARAATLMDEVVAAAAACGHGFDPRFADRMMADDRADDAVQAEHEARPRGRPAARARRHLRRAHRRRRAPPARAMPETEALLAELRRLDPSRRSRSRVSSGSCRLGGTSRATAP